jgi:hypothetical protein
MTRRQRQYCNMIQFINLCLRAIRGGQTWHGHLLAVNSIHPPNLAHTASQPPTTKHVPYSTLIWPRCRFLYRYFLQFVVYHHVMSSAVPMLFNLSLPARLDNKFFQRCLELELNLIMPSVQFNWTWPRRRFNSMVQVQLNLNRNWTCPASRSITLNRAVSNIVNTRRL